MELNGVGVRNVRRKFEPLRRLDAVLAATNKSDDSLRVEAARVVDGLEEDLVQLVDLGCVLCGVAGRFVDRLESDQARLAAQRGADLIPQPVEFLLDHGQIGPGRGDVRPLPGVCLSVSACVKSGVVLTVVDVDNGIQISGGDHVDDI